MDLAELRGRSRLRSWASGFTICFCLVALFGLGCRKPVPPALPAQPAPAPAAIKDEPPEPAKSFDINFRSFGQRVPVIMYHDIVERRGPGTVWFDCTAEEFKGQMQLLQERGYQAISLDELHRHLTEGTQIAPRSVVITFDDNYQGFYDYAWPLLKEMKFPVAMFVHTGFVGSKKNRPHMSWETLKELIKNPLVSIGSHTVTHPDLPTLTPAEQTQELTESKETLERQLGRSVDYFAYPDGKNDQATQDLAKAAGYTMSFSIENGPAEESPSIECVNRYIQTRLVKALDECETTDLACGIFTIDLKPDVPIAYREEKVDGKALALVTGGRPMSVTSMAREGVLDFMHRTGTVAGINGTFFDMAAISATDNKLVGPSKTGDSPDLLPDNEKWRWPKLRNRPMVIWGPTQAAVVTYNPARMNDETAYKEFMPDYSDAFLGGAWLVHDNMPRAKEQLELFASKDLEDPRRRAAFGFMPDGSAVAAASKDSVSSLQFAEILAKVGLQEAVLLDSGFSTSLVYGEKIMASGHSTPDKPSRPVPHAIVFRGTLDPASQEAAAAAVPATNPTADEAKAPRRRHRRKRKTANSAPPESEEATAPATTNVPPPPP